MLARRLLAIVAVLMALTLVAAMLAPPPQPKAPVTGGVEAPAEPVDPTIEIRLDAGTDVGVAEVAQDDVVHLAVTADTLDTVELRGLDLLATVAPDTPAEFNLLADRPGDYPIVLQSADETIGTLRVNPAGA